MSSVHISQIYACSSINYACELYYACELGKYLYLGYNKPLSLDGVLLSSDLNKSNLWDMFRIAVKNGWVIDCNIDADDVGISIQNPMDYATKSLANIEVTLDEVAFDREDFNLRKNDLEYNLMTPQKMQVSFKEITDKHWYWTLYGNENNGFLVNNKTLNSNNANQSWLSLIAYVAVTRAMTGQPDKLLLEFNREIVDNTMALSYIIMLTDKTNCLKDWCYFTFDESVTNKNLLHFGYTAWYVEGKDKGYLNRWYSQEEKLAHLKKLNIKVGDMIGLYERNKEQKMNYIKSISGFFIAKVTEITSRTISLECIVTKKTKCQAKADFDDKTIAVKRMYSFDKPYEKLITRKMKLDLNDVGVEYLMYTELYMLVPLEQCEDSVRQLVTDGTRTIEVDIPQNDLVYWICKDYDFEFDEERFLDKYFKDSEPMYTRFMRGDDITDKTTT